MKLMKEKVGVINALEIVEEKQKQQDESGDDKE